MTKTIMIIDDSEDDIFIAKRRLRRRFSDIEILEAVDGVHAIEVLEKLTTWPDLIFLDINMPRMDGHAFLNQWYRDLGHSVPVVVMLTSSDQTADLEQANAFDCVKDYFVKPMSKQHLEDLEALIAVT